MSLPQTPYFHTEDKTAVFIDGANLYAATKTLELDIDYKKLLEWVGEQTRLVRAYYYTALFDDYEYSPIRPLVDWLEYNGFTIITKQAKEQIDAQGRKRIKGNMDIDIAVDMLEMADRLDHVILFSGDGDFCHLIEAIQRKGVKATVISTLKTENSMISDDLRRQADQFIDLADLVDIISKESDSDQAAA